MEVSGQLHAPAALLPVTHWIGDRVGLRAGMDTKNKKKSDPCRELNPGRPAHTPSIYRLSYPDSCPIIGIAISHTCNATT
jgi:hypothetical protein